MELLNFLLLIVILFIIVSGKSNLEKKISRLISQIDELKKEPRTPATPGPSWKEQMEEAWKEEPNSIVEPVAPEEDIPEFVSPPIVIEESAPDLVEELMAYQEIEEVVTIQKEEPKPSFFQRNDLEKFIGENLINKIGIGILVLGIGFFVKYAIDQDWINEIGRVFIGIVCGGILIGFAHKTKEKFKAFSSVLVGGGMAIFYFSIAIAFHEYELLSQTAAFLIMALITGFSVLLAIAYDRKELAVLAIIGGFGSPFMVSTGAGNYIVLFTYILTLNIGMLVLAFFKKWNLLNIISYVFTIILFGGWLSKEIVNEPDFPYVGALVFATLFYLVFFLMNILNNIKANRKFKAAEISILLSNTFLYYSAGMIILQDVQGGVFQGLFTALLGVFNFVFAYSLYKSKRADLNLIYLLIGLVLTFVSLAAPVQLEGNYITLFWALEAVLLLWLSQKSGMQIIKLSSVIVMALMAISLMMDWEAVYGTSSNLNMIFNKAFITSFVSLTAIALTLFLLKKEGKIEVYGVDISLYKPILSAAFVVFVYVALLLELDFHLNANIESFSFRNVIRGSYNLLFILLLSLFLIRQKSVAYSLGAIVLSIFGTVAYITYYHAEIISVRNDYLYGADTSLGNYLFHYIITMLAIALLILSLKNIKNIFGLKSKQGTYFLWYLTFASIFIASAELDHLVLLFNNGSALNIDHILNQNHKIGYPILWGIGSFILMSIGMRKKIKDLRIISLSVFAIILLKLFILDIRGISEGGKIAAFICLGILLLVVSFMYQKLKNLLLENEPNGVNKP